MRIADINSSLLCLRGETLEQGRSQGVLLAAPPCWDDASGVALPDDYLWYRVSLSFCLSFSSLFNDHRILQPKKNLLCHEWEKWSTSGRKRTQIGLEFDY